MSNIDFRKAINYLNFNVVKIKNDIRKLEKKTIKKVKCGNVIYTNLEDFVKAFQCGEITFSVYSKRYENAVEKLTPKENEKINELKELFIFLMFITEENTLREIYNLYEKYNKETAYNKYLKYLN